MFARACLRVIAREVCLLFDGNFVCFLTATLVRADVVVDKDEDDEKDDKDEKDAQIVALKKQLAALTVKPPKPKKKVRVSKWKVEHAKVVADVEPMLATIKAFD